jgi:hypothetical protein
MLYIGELVSHFRNPATLYKVQPYFRCVNFVMLTFIGRHALSGNTELTIRLLRENIQVATNVSEKKRATSIFRLEDGSSLCFKNRFFVI